MPQLSHLDTLTLRQTVRIEDLLLLPAHVPFPTGQDRMYALAESYAAERSANAGNEPGWTRNMPLDVQMYLRMHYALTCEDAFQIVGRLTYAGLSYLVLGGGLCEDVFHTFNLWRLSYIKQLGYLQVPDYNKIERLGPLSEGTRGLHILDVMAIASVIGYNLGLSKSVMHTLRTEALTHDTGTPAGGDSVKMIDPLGLDEDANYSLILDRIDFASLAEKYDLDRNTLIEGIQNKGLLGEILDIADKLAYVARDLTNCRHHLEAGELRGDLPGPQALIKLLQEFPHVCGIWDCIQKTDDGRIFFTDAKRLVAFLKVRVLLFRELYYHPASRYGEFLISRILVKYLYDTGKVTRDQLLTMFDAELQMRLNKEFGIELGLETCASDIARVAQFWTLDEGKAFRDQLQLRNNPFVILDDNRQSIKTGDHFLVATPDGPRPLSEADPQSTTELQELATARPMVHVYYLDGIPKLKKKKLEKLVADLHSSAAR